MGKLGLRSPACEKLTAAERAVRNKRRVATPTLVAITVTLDLMGGYCCAHTLLPHTPTDAAPTPGDSGMCEGGEIRSDWHLGTHMLRGGGFVGVCVVATRAGGGALIVFAQRLEKHTFSSRTQALSRRLATASRITSRFRIPHVNAGESCRPLRQTLFCCW